MQCPKCRFEHDAQASECPRCGVIFAKYARRLQAAAAGPIQREENGQVGAPHDKGQEVIYRLFAVPSALIGARLLVSIAPAAVRMLSMWIHECGHAVTAWLCGFWSIPGPWFTPVASNRSPVLTIVLAGLIGFGSIHAWRNRRWGLALGGVAALILQFICTFKLYSDQAQQLIIFGGDAGCFVLGTVLVATFYVRRQSILYENGLRWGFLIIGALTFMDAFAVWSGGIERIPFGENENGLSDPSVLTEMYGWSVRLLMARYYRLALSCLIILAAAYGAGIAIGLSNRPPTEATRLRNSGASSVTSAIQP